MKNEAVGSALLHIAAAPASDHTAILAALDDTDWFDCIGAAAELRIAPLLQNAISRSGCEHLLPDEATRQLSTIQRITALRVLNRSKAMARINTLLKTNGLEPVFVKGAALAHTVYPSASWRPSRDLDILLRAQAAPEAQRVLLGSGEFENHPALPYDQNVRHHLFPLRHLETDVAVEVHHALLGHPDWDGEAALVSALLKPGNSIKVLGETIAVPAPEANILHLSMHAGRASSFDNGPLLLADMHFLVEQSRCDLDRVLDRARDLRLANSLLMLTALAEQNGASWPTPRMSREAVSAQQFLSAAKDAVLPSRQDLADNKLVSRVDRRQRSGGVLAPLAMAMAPDRKALAQSAGVTPGSVWRWVGYPRWLASRVGQYWRVARARNLERDRQFRDWLAKD